MKPSWYGEEDEEQSDLPSVQRIVQRQQYQNQVSDLKTLLVDDSSTTEEHWLVRQYRTLGLGEKGAAAGPPIQVTRDILLRMFQIDVPSDVLRILSLDQVHELCVNKFAESLKPFNIAISEISSVEKLQAAIEFATKSPTDSEFRQKAIDSIARQEGLRGIPGRTWLARNKARIDELAVQIQQRNAGAGTGVSSSSLATTATVVSSAATKAPELLEPTKRDEIVPISTPEQAIRNQIHCCVNPIELLKQGPPRDHGLQVPLHALLQRSGPPRSSTY